MSRIIGGLVATLAALALAAPAAEAVERPFKLVESGTATFDGEYVSGVNTGYATHLGKVTVYRRARLFDPDGSVFKAHGYATLVAADGDRLFSSLDGTVDLATGLALLTYEWEGGTGRFEDATGTTTWQAQLNPDLTYSLEAEGVIDY
jgi:hypothetical protein